MGANPNSDVLIRGEDPRTQAEGHVKMEVE